MSRRRCLIAFAVVIFAKCFSCCSRHKSLMIELGRLLFCLVMILLIISAAVAPVWLSGGATVSTSAVCGKVAGLKFSIPESYLVFGPGYTSEESPVSRSILQPNRCNKNIVSLRMAMSWPNMEPVPPGDALSLYFDGILTVVEPFSDGGLGLNDRLASYTRSTPAEVIEAAQFSDDLSLYVIDGIDNAFPSLGRVFFWSDLEGRQTVIGHCSRGDKQRKYTFCKLSFLLADDAIIVSLTFPIERLYDWSSMVAAVSEFLGSNVIEEGVND